MKASLRFCSKTAVAAVFLSALLLNGCGTGVGGVPKEGSNDADNRQGDGTVVVNANFAKDKALEKLGVEQAEVASMTIAASSATGDLGTVDCNQSGEGTLYSCVRTDLPIGVGITLGLSAYPAARATDPATAAIYTGSAVVNIAAGSGTKKVTINMLAAGGQPTSIPVILNFATTLAPVLVGQAATMSVEVADGDATLLTVTFTSSSGGVFTPKSVGVTPTATGSATASTSFTAADLGTGPYTDSITVTVTDGAEFTVEQSISLAVVSPLPPTIEANLPPEINSIAAADLGAMVKLTAQVTDDQDVAGLTYEWTVAGTTNPLTIAKPVDGAEIVVTVTDALGAARGYTLLWRGVITPPDVLPALTVCSFACDHTVIQAAIDTAKPGQGVLVKDGMYVENLSITKSVSLKSQNGAGVTVIDGQKKTVVTISGSTVTIDGFKIANGEFGIGISSGSTLTVVGSTISGNSAIQAGGIFVDSSTVTVRSSTISGNSAYVGGGISATNSMVTVRSSTISGNSVYNPMGSYGGGIYTSNSSVTVTDSSILGNISNYRGGGIYAKGSTVTVTGSRILGNISDSNSSYIKGGGGIYAMGSSIITVEKSIVEGNSSPFGAGMYTQGAGTSLTMTNTLLANNIASNQGGAFYLADYAAVDLLHNTIVNNTAATNGGGIYVTGSSVPKAFNNILWGNKVGANPSQIEVAANNFITIVHSDVEGGYSGTGNIDLDPGFVANDPQFNITDGSPVIDAGTGQVTGVPQLPVDDHQGDPRPSGAGYDMGWDEFVPPVIP